MNPKLSNDEIIDVRNVLLAKAKAAGDVTALSVHDQKLYDDCNIALCGKPEARAEARERISRLISHSANNGQIMKIPLWQWISDLDIKDEMFWKSAAQHQVSCISKIADMVGVGCGRPHDAAPVGAFVIATHRSKSISLPVVSLERSDLGVRFVMRSNFDDWKLSVITERPIIDDGFQYLFRTAPPPDPEYTGDPLDSCYFEGFPSDLVFGYYLDGCKRAWSAQLHGDHDVWTTLFLCMKQIGGLKRQEFGIRKSKS